MELESPPDLPAGPMEVVLRSLASPDPGNEDWWQYVQCVRAELKAAGGPLRTAEAIDKARRDCRDSDDRMEELYRQSRGEGQNGASDT
jgi:hypothetical protein